MRDLGVSDTIPVRAGSAPAGDSSDKPKMYVVVDAELTVGEAAAQAVHAAFQFSQQHPEVTADWHRSSQYLVVLAAPDEVALIALVSRANHAGLAVSAWHEPDWADRITAVALEPGDTARRLCSSLPLHGKETSRRPALAAV